MDDGKHLNGFCRLAAQDKRLLPVHLSLYLALFGQWSEANFTNPFVVYRPGLMQVARIRSRVTYHKRLRELHRFGYIRYQPTYNYFEGSMVTMLPPSNALKNTGEEIPHLPLK